MNRASLFLACMTIVSPSVFATGLTFSPFAAEARQGAFVLTITGVGFGADSVVTWNGTKRVSVYNSAKRDLEVSILDTDVAAPVIPALPVSVNIVVSSGAGTVLGTGTFAIYAPCGTSLGDLNGVAIQYNGKYIGGGTGCGGAQKYGQAYACPEFVRRYYGQLDLMTPAFDPSLHSLWMGDAYTYFKCTDSSKCTSAQTKGLTIIPNDGTVPPDVNDILVFDNGSSGHVAIVTQFSSTGVEVAEQNGWVGQGKMIEFDPQEQAGGRWKLEDRGPACAKNPMSSSCYHPVAWLRPANRKPWGYLDNVDGQTGQISGWAEDQDNPSVPISVHIYIDNNAGTLGAVPVGAVLASGVRSDVGAHGFNYTIPASFRDGQSHTIWVWAIDLTDTTGDHNVQLSGSSRTFNLPPTNQPPTAGVLMVSGNQSATDGQTLNLTVAPGTSAAVSVSAGASHANFTGGSIAGWSWSVNGSQVSTSPSFGQAFFKGTYQISLVVTDSAGAVSALGSGTVNVTESAHSGPTELYQTPLYNDPSLVSYWRFEGNSDDTKGSNNGNDTNIIYGPSYGMFGRGALFDSVPDSYIQKNSPVALPVGNQDLTVNVWANPRVVQSSGVPAFLAWGSEGWYQMAGFGLSDTGFYWLGYGNDVSQAYTYLTGGWTMFSATYTAATRTVQFYANGAVVGSGHVLPSSPNVGSSFLIFSKQRPGNAVYFDGDMDDASIFSRVLSSPELSSLSGGAANINVTVSGYSIDVSCRLNGINITAPTTLSNMPAGTYTLSCTAPAGYTISSITPSATQTLSAGGEVSFALAVSIPAGTPPPAIWPMSGHDPQRTGRSAFIGSTIVPRGGQLTFDAGAALVGDLTISAEGNLYFVTSSSLYVLTSAGTAYVPPLAVAAVTGPAIDDQNGYVYIGLQNGPSSWNLVRYTKQLQNPTVIYSGTGVPGPLIIGNNGVVYSFVGGTALARGPVQWSAAVCPAFNGAPSIGQNGDVYGMCGDGLHRVDGNTGLSPIQSSYAGGNEPMIDSAGNLHAGYEGIGFGGATFVVWGDYSSWDANLNHTASNSNDYTTSRASLALDGTSTVRLGASDYLGDNNLSFRGSTSWDLSANSFTGSTAFTTIPTVDGVGKIFVGMNNGMACISAADHSTIWQFAMSEPVVTQPVIASTGTVYVATSSGKIYSFST